MALSYGATGLQVQRWDDKFFREYLGWNKFSKYMGTDENAIIQVKEDLTARKGRYITFSLVNRLTNAGVAGSATLEGAEERMDTRSFQVQVAQIRNGVVVPWSEDKFSAIGLRDAARVTLMDWMMENIRDTIVAQLGSINGVLYADATEAQKDAWLVDNTDRAQYGALVANHVSLDSNTSLATIDNTADKLTPDLISLVKRRATAARPRIRPIRVRKAGDEEWFVMFCNSLSFRDLSVNATMTAANRDARVRGEGNPLFTGGDLLWDGVIIREIPEIAVVTGVGAGSINVAPNYFCGAQALGYGMARRPFTKTQLTDYEDKYGVAVGEVRGIRKMLFGSGATDTDDLKDNGVFTVWTAAVADA